MSNIRDFSGSGQETCLVYLFFELAVLLFDSSSSGYIVEKKKLSDEMVCPVIKLRQPRPED
jgi:hypothetical protein